MAKSKKPIADALGAAKEKATAVREVVHDTAADHLETAQLHAMEAQDALLDHAETARLHSLELQDQFGEFVRRQPTASVALALGAGVLLGILAAPRR